MHLNATFPSGILVWGALEATVPPSVGQLFLFFLDPLQQKVADCRATSHMLPDILAVCVLLQDEVYAWLSSGYDWSVCCHSTKCI